MNNLYILLFSLAVTSLYAATSQFTLTPDSASADHGEMTLIDGNIIDNEWRCVGNRYVSREYCSRLSLNSLDSSLSITNVKLTIYGYRVTPGAAATQFTTFSVNNEEYFTIVNDWDANAANYPLDDGGIAIAPPCGSDNLFTTDDVSALLNTADGLNTNVFENLGDGDESNFEYLTNGYNGETSPITIELVNDIENNEIDVYFESDSVSELVCSYDTSFDPNYSNEMDVYFSTYWGPATLTMTQIDVDLTFEEVEDIPTPEPTEEPVEGCSEYIRVTSLTPGTTWVVDGDEVDTSIYLGDYCFDGLSTKFYSLGGYPVYVLNDGLAYITANPFKTTAISWFIWLYDENDLDSSIGRFLISFTDPTLVDDTYILINDQYTNPFDGTEQNWITNAYPGSIDLKAELFDNLAETGFDLP